MNIVGIDAVRYGVDDLDAGRRYFSEFGLTETEHGATGAKFVTMEQSEIQLFKNSESSLPAPPVEGPTIRELVFGVKSNQALEEIGAELAKDREVTRDSEGALHTFDTSGYGIAFRVSRCQPLGPEASPPVNLPGNNERRIDQRIDYSALVQVRHIGHAVYYVKDIKEASDFYMRRLGFRLSDSFTGCGSFMRAAGAREHHTLFLFAIEPYRGPHHIAFEVGDFNEVMLGGLGMQRHGWQSELGPGRHIIGSNYFWYWKSPCGSRTEYYADIDHVTDAWKPREWEFKPEVVAGWMVTAQDQKVDRFD
ncbi:MAG: VOC family protein [Candidatus Binataceae bacterium]